tara:strand:+ start:486 stop:1025 length:540 start_codon:yes stop_codon:yes gene_type:complete
MENWRKLLKEEERRQQILEYLKENNITLTEEELEEAMPKWMKKLGAGAALGATLMGAPAPAQAADAPVDDVPVQVDQQGVMEADEVLGLLGYIQTHHEHKKESTAPGRDGLSDRSNLAQKYAPLYKALKSAVGGDSSATDRLDVDSKGLLELFQKHYNQQSPTEQGNFILIGKSIETAR